MALKVSDILLDRAFPEQLCAALTEAQAASDEARKFASGIVNK
ncbi:hypothetical protein [Rhodoblastus sp.]